MEDFLGCMVVTCMGWLGTPSFVSGLNAWWIVVFGVEHVIEEYLEAVDLTSYVGTIPIWLASYLLVRSTTHCSSSTSR